MATSYGKIPHIQPSGTITTTEIGNLNVLYLRERYQQIGIGGFRV